MANHETVPGSAFTKGTTERRKSATSSTLPSIACSGTRSAHIWSNHSSPLFGAASDAADLYFFRLRSESVVVDVVEYGEPGRPFFEW